VKAVALVVVLALVASPVEAQPLAQGVADTVAAPGAREALARVAYAEAAGQGAAGLAGVVFTILNRVAAGRWGGSIEAVVNARGQFEPVLRVGGDWRGLPAVTPGQRARIDTIVDLALEGRLPDPTAGALYFQNVEIVAARARQGLVSAGLVGFGGAAPSAKIGDHTFYGAMGSKPTGPRAAADPIAPAGRDIFVPPAALIDRTSAPGAAPEPILPDVGVRGVFVRANGEVAEDMRVRP
jgi:N-acetylmuramoyl-L-alanine amidase